jgi:hypothetical protein
MGAHQDGRAWRARRPAAWAPHSRVARHQRRARGADVRRLLAPPAPHPAAPRRPRPQLSGPAARRPSELYDQAVELGVRDWAGSVQAHRRSVTSTSDRACCRFVPADRRLEVGRHRQCNRYTRVRPRHLQRPLLQPRVGRRPCRLTPPSEGMPDPSHRGAALLLSPAFQGAGRPPAHYRNARVALARAVLRGLSDLPHCDSAAARASAPPRAAADRPTQQRADARTGAPRQLLCREAGVAPCAPGCPQRASDAGPGGARRLAEEERCGRAVRAQQAVSQQIRALAGTLVVTLVRRNSRRVELTFLAPCSGT